MRKFMRSGVMIMGLMAAVFLSGCAETQFLASTAKHSGAQQNNNGKYKVGNPYQIQGVWYYPSEDYEYTESGIASWYGPQFQGKSTANGEVFDMNLVSAAHRTLPLPSIVRVTNLENGRSLIVRVNDRGPFAHSRILDMSKRGAQLLGYADKGTARVKVELLKDQSLALKNSLVNELSAENSPIKSGSMAKPQVSSQSLSVPSGGTQAPEKPAQKVTMIPQRAPEPAPVLEEPSQNVKRVQVSATQMYIQAGAFSRFDNANRVKASLASVGDVEVSQILVNGRDFYRVRIGPLSNVSDADKVLENVIRAGYPAAKIIIEKS
jgi:rare lipoprotein A